MKKILVPTDFSDCAQYALDVAKSMAVKTGSELFVLHLEETVPEAVHVLHHAIVEENPHHLGHARYQLQQIVSSIEREGIKVRPIFVPHEGRESIEDYIQPYGVDFMVMGSHGASGTREFFIGSNTQRVIRESSVPVLVIKRPAKDFNPKKILFASTFRENVSKSLKEIVSFTKLWDAELDLVFLNLLSHLIEEHEAKKIMSQQMEFDPSQQYTLNISETNDEEWGISKFARVIGSDLIAVVYDSHTGFNRLFNSSVAEKLINHEEIPILILNHQ